MRNTSTTRPLMIQGTASASGKSLLATALCRIFLRDGQRVAPFKAQNMSNNSFVTAEGLEMGRAQVVQAVACGLQPDVRMNPVLLKPATETGAQAVVHGTPAFQLDARNWQQSREQLRAAIRESYDALARDFSVIVIEGAGSPAEINLKKNDLVNMGMAAMADAPVILVGDIDRGGVFASLVGTMALLDDDERARVQGFVINKFRGHIDLLQDGLDRLEQLTNVPVLGVVPWVRHVIDDEDGVSLRLEGRAERPRAVDIAVIRLPHISNFTDFLPLEAIPEVSVRYCDTAADIGAPDLLILPGTKATIADLHAIRAAGIADRLIAYVRDGGHVLGICGGFQMLGAEIRDPGGAESRGGSTTGLGLLDMTTEFHQKKQTTQTSAILHGAAHELFAPIPDTPITGYEIHMGQSAYGPAARRFTTVQTNEKHETILGIAEPSGRVAGTYLHGLFDSSRVTLGVINAIRERKGLAPLTDAIDERRVTLERGIDALATVVAQSLDMEAVYRILGTHPPPVG